MMAEEGQELEGKAPSAQCPAMKIRSKIEILDANSAQIEEIKQHTARRSARNNYPRGLEHHSAVEVEEEHGDEAPWSRSSFSANRVYITKAESIWSQIDTARSLSLGKKEMRGEGRL